MESAISFGELLRRFRKYNDYTQAETAQRLGYSEETIKSWEQGRRFPVREEVARLADLMELDEQTVKRSI
jgi:transcriptional regulator with XRE-family HTH domain